MPLESEAVKAENMILISIIVKAPVEFSTLSTASFTMIQSSLVECVNCNNVVVCGEMFIFQVASYSYGLYISIENICLRYVFRE